MKYVAHMVISVCIVASASFARGNVVLAAFEPNGQEAVLWHRLELSFNVSSMGKIGKFKLVTPDAVTTSTQTDATVSVSFKPSVGTLRPNEILEKTIKDTTPEHDTMLFRKWKRGSSAAFDGGVSGKVTYTVSLYYKRFPTQSFPLSETPLAVKSEIPIDYLNPAVVNYFGRNGFALTADQKRLDPSGLSDCGAIAKLFRTPISYGGVTVSASTTAKRGVSDCGGQAQLFVAGCRLLNIPARTNIGWLIREKGLAMENHVRAEFQQQGQWYPAEITGYRTANTNPRNPVPIEKFIGVEGDWSPHFFTMMYSNGLHFELKDDDGEYTIFGDANSLALQKPWFKAYGVDGQELKSSVTGPVIKVIQ